MLEIFKYTFFFLIIFPAGISAQDKVKYKVGFLGTPNRTNTEWNDENILRMKELGFNALQLSIAWGNRPNDEILNLEDVLELPDRYLTPTDKELKNSLHSPERIQKRSRELKHRIEISRKYGFHTIFHFGAPFVGDPPIQADPLPQCIMDSVTINRYITLVREFSKKFPGVNDLLMYTYDQDAWLCSEAGTCPRCHGIPVDTRAANFVNTIARTWKSINPDGRLWWEPWELSAGQVYKAIDQLDASCVGMAIHSNIAEVQIAHPADRWFQNVLYLTAQRNIPVIAEVWTGCPTEEMDTYRNIAAPLLTLRQLRVVSSAGKLAGIKEYYGNNPDDEDPNLRITSLFFSNPQISDDDAMREISLPYKEAAEGVKKYWELSSQAIAFYPWDVSWQAREVGRINPVHSMNAALLRGASWDTPSWQSSRRTHFMRTDQEDEPNFWMKEDMQLQFERCALFAEQAIRVGDGVKQFVPAQYADDFNTSISELSSFKRNVLSYVYHLRETNLADNIRTSLKLGLPEKQRQENISELRNILLKDMENQQSDEPVLSAIRLLDTDLNKFLETYFLHKAVDDKKLKWSITSE
jgi:hypothetical protein